jgi:hypothetical protein
LRDQGLVRTRREQPWIYCSVDAQAWCDAAQFLCWLVMTPLDRLPIDTLPHTIPLYGLV